MPASRLPIVVLTAAMATALPAFAADEPAPAAPAAAPTTVAAAEAPTAVASAAGLPAPAAAVQAVSPASIFNPAGLPFSAGMYQCELNRKVHVRSVTPDLQSAVLSWDRKEYTMRAVGTRTGALRYEDAASGLVWLVIVGKSMLLDTRRGQQLANECKT